MSNEELKEKEREEFLDVIEKNPKMLYDLPVEKLEKLKEYYEYSISKKEEQLRKLKQN